MKTESGSAGGGQEQSAEKVMVSHRRPGCTGPVEIVSWRHMSEPMREHRDQYCEGCHARWFDDEGTVTRPQPPSGPGADAAQGGSDNRG